MAKKILKSKFWVVTGLCLMVAVSYSDAFAWGRGGHGREVVVVGHQRYHYHDGRFYRRGWFGFELAVVTPPIGAVVRVLPFGYRTIIVAGSPYYYCDNVYYRSSPSGYIVIPDPALTSNVVSAPAVAQPQAYAGQTITINVPNANGSYTPVTLIRRNNGYIGPQGEYYPEHPTVEQLKVLYGK